MTKLFKKKPEQELKSVRYQIRLTIKDDEKIRHSAKIRQMDVSEFIRRAALGRKANVDYETEIVLALIDITRAIRALHAAMVKQSFLPPEELLLPVILEARAAMLRISK
jgi:uncharacterized protein (DUF1778 family)